MNAQHFATRARSALCQRWPELERYHQGSMLMILEQVCLASQEIENAQCAKKVPAVTMVPPTPEEVIAFLKELDSDLNPQDFIDHYQSNGWLVGRVKMRDWRSAARRAHRMWQRPGQRNAGGTTVAVKPMGEWERKSKMERLKALQAELHELRHPGGAAWAVFLAGAKAKQATDLCEKIAALKTELEA